MSEVNIFWYRTITDSRNLQMDLGHATVIKH